MKEIAICTGCKQEIVMNTVNEKGFKPIGTYPCAKCGFKLKVLFSGSK